MPDVLIIGAGAAGLMCAIEAGNRGRSVVVLEHADRVGKKIAISGGGRCNFTNRNAGPENYLSGNPDFCKSALARYPAQRFIDLVEAHGIPYHEKKLGQLFCDGSAREIIQLLLDECKSAGVTIRLCSQIREVRKPGRFSVELDGEILESDSLVIASGGLSFPKVGATSLGHDIARKFDVRLTDLRPGLVPLTFSEPDSRRYGTLSGISLPTIITRGKRAFEENILFTHRGLSGPAILQISSYWKEGESLDIDTLPGVSGTEWLRTQQGGRMELANLLAQKLPRRFVDTLCDIQTASTPVHRHTTATLENMGRKLNRWEFKPAGTEGYAKAEVTLGGVDTGELSSKTMESRHVPGLFFIGEVVDVTGWLGGYNFQWAWASGHAAGQAI